MIKKITDLWPNLVRRITQPDEPEPDRGDDPGSDDEGSDREALLREGNMPTVRQDGAVDEEEILSTFKNLYWTRLITVSEAAAGDGD